MERDSAGVTIVENTEAVWAADSTSAWRVQSEPALSIGDVEGTPQYQLHRVSGALRLSDGTIVVANGGSSEIRYYDSAGAYVRSVGRKGGGPGEYQFLRFLKRYGADSLLAWDPPLARGTVLSMAGSHGRTILVPQLADNFFRIIDASSDGSLFGVVSSGIALENTQPGLFRSDASLFRLSRTGQIDTVAQLFEAESFISNGPPKTLIGMPFGRRGVFAVSGTNVYHGSGDTFEIRTYTQDGELLRITRALVQNPPLSREAIDAFIESGPARIKDPGTRRKMLDLHNQVTYPKTLPAYGDLIVDRDGNLWAGGYARLGDPVPNWKVFDAHGRILGDVAMPARFFIHEIGSDYVLGSARDTLDVEHVVLHRLLKPKS